MYKRIMHRDNALRNSRNKMHTWALHTCIHCGLTGVHPKGRFCPAYGKRCYSCKKFNHFALVCKSKTDKRIDIRGVKCNEEEQSFWIKHLTNEIEEKTDDNTDKEFEAKLVEHMRMSSYLGDAKYVNEQERTHDYNRQENSDTQFERKDISKENKNQEKPVTGDENYLLVEQLLVNAMQEGMIHLKSELVVIQIENKKLRESLSKQREEWTECQRRLAELNSITKQQKQETKDVKQRKDACRIRGKHNLAIIDGTASEWIDIEPDSQTEERRYSDNQEENVYGNAWTVTSDCRKRRHLKSEGRHLIDSTSWLRDEAEELTNDVP